MFRLNEYKMIYSDDLSEYNKILGIVIPTNNPSEMFNKFLTGLKNLSEIKDFATLLINFQGWSQEDIDKCIDIIHDNGFKVRYTINKYDISNGIPFNLIVQDAGNLMTDCKVYLRMDDDIIPGGWSPTIKKTCGQQYLECLHYMLTHERCGTIVTTGTIGKLPKRDYLGPSQKFINDKHSYHSYVLTGLGLFLKNIDESDGILPSSSLGLVGALEDALNGGYRLANGYYVAKYNHVRAVHRFKTKSLSKSQDSKDLSPYQWERNEVLMDNADKFIKENWNPNYDCKNYRQVLVSKDLYLKMGGPDVNKESVVSSLIEHYPVGINNESLINDIIKYSHK